MTEKDLIVYNEVFSNWAKDIAPSRVLLLNPDKEQVTLFNKIFPFSIKRQLNYPHYDCSKGSPPNGPWDIVFLANTFMCAENPDLWFDNLLESCNEIWMQELVRAHRNGSFGELSPETGDVCRFTFPKRNELSRVNGYELDENKKIEIKDIVFYYDNPASIEYDTRKFVAKIRKKQI